MQVMLEGEKTTWRISFSEPSRSQFKQAPEHELAAQGANGNAEWKGLICYSIPETTAVLSPDVHFSKTSHLPYRQLHKSNKNLENKL